MTTTAHHLVHAAVLRDLNRARIVLSTELEIRRDRRHALADHLAWLVDLVSAESTGAAAATDELRTCARAFRVCGDRVQRRDAYLAVTALGTALGEHPEWVAPSALVNVAHQVHWLVDGLDARRCEHLTRLFSPHTPHLRLRLRADVYRYRKELLWGGTRAYGRQGQPVVPAQRTASPAPAG